jgi:chitinase
MIEFGGPWKYKSIPERSAFLVYSDLATSTGIPENKTKIGNYDRGNACAPSAGPDDPCWSFDYDYNVPVINGYTAADVANPKDIVAKGLDQAKLLGPQIDGLITLTKLDSYMSDKFELIDTISLPILMLTEAMENMATIEDIADKIDAAKRKAIILAFLGALFLIIPVIGEVASAVTEAANIALILDLVAAVGNSATDIYTFVDDPKNAPLAIFDLVLNTGALLDVAQIAKAATIKRGMSAEEMGKLGDKIASRMESLDKVKGKCYADR